VVNYKSLFLQSITKYNNHNKWDNGDYIGIKTVSNTSVGDVGQHFIECICQAHGFKASPPMRDDGKARRQSSWDMDIEGIKFEIKTASEDVNGYFQFNHIRYHRSYDAVLCLGVSPNDLYFGLWTAAQIKTGKAGTLVSMEKSANASYKLTKKSKDLYKIVDFNQVLHDFIGMWDWN